MGLVYTAEIDASISVAADIFNLLAPSDAVLEILGMELAQDNIEGDANADQIEILMSRVTGSPTDGTGGSTPTPRPTHQGYPASGVTARAGDVTTKLSGGTKVTLRRSSFNVAVGLFYTPIPEARYFISPSTRFLVEIPNAPDAATQFTGTIEWRELGG
jgi:hypothetical protein